MSDSTFLFISFDLANSTEYKRSNSDDWVDTFGNFFTVMPARMKESWKNTLNQYATVFNWIPTRSQDQDAELSANFNHNELLIWNWLCRLREQGTNFVSEIIAGAINNRTSSLISDGYEETWKEEQDKARFRSPILLSIGEQDLTDESRLILAETSWLSLGLV